MHSGGSSRWQPVHQSVEGASGGTLGGRQRGQGAQRRATIGLHECRHTYVSLMHAAGRTLEAIGDFAGHSSSYITDRYRRLIDGQPEEAAAAFDSYLTGAHQG